MAFRQTLTTSVNVAGEFIQNTMTAEAEGQNSAFTTLDPVPGATTDRLVNFNLDVSACKGFYMVCDRNVTVETNSSSSPANTIVLQAGVPYIWMQGMYHSFLFTSDITALYVTNAGADPAILRVYALFDPTP